MTADPADVLARINKTISFADGSRPEEPLRLILEEEGPEALIQAILDAADPAPTDPQCLSHHHGCRDNPMHCRCMRLDCDGNHRCACGHTWAMPGPDTTEGGQ